MRWWVASTNGWAEKRPERLSIRFVGGFGAMFGGFSLGNKLDEPKEFNSKESQSLERKRDEIW